MATTPFYIPSSIQQVEILNEITNNVSIPWAHTENVISKDNYAITTKPLSTISGFWQEKFYRETSQLWTTGYDIPVFNAPVVGIALQINVQRKARIQDLVIQLTLNGELIGDNYASLINPVTSDMNTAEFTDIVEPVQDYHVYGGATDMWGTELTAEDVSNSSFGAVISFKSNQIIPHSDLVYLDQVGIQIIYG